MAHFPDQEVVKQTSQFQNVGFFCIEIGSTKHFLSPFLPFDLQHKISGTKLSRNLKNKMLFLVYKNESHSFSACFAKKTKNQQKLGRTKSFSSKPILHISLCKRPKNSKTFEEKNLSPQKLSSASLFVKYQKTPKTLKN